MSSERPFERFSPDPFARTNPFAVLGTGPRCGGAELAAQTAAAQLRCGSTQEQSVLRDALRELTADPIRRAEWEVFTPHVAPAPPAAAIDAAAKALGRLLFGGEPAAGHAGAALRQFAAFLNWDRRAQRQPAALADESVVRQWWQAATHVHSVRWEYWHQLALLYQGQACAAERLATSGEAECSLGRPSRQVDASRLDAYWLRAHRCWSRTVECGGLWESIRGHVAGLAGYSAERFESLRVELPLQLAGMHAKRIEQAVAGGNRLAAAHHRRYLAALADGPDTAALAPSARTAADRMTFRLWGPVRQCKDDCRKRFAEIFRGLLLIAPEDVRIVEEAVAAIVETGNSEQTFHPGDFHESAAMAAQMDDYVGPLCRHVFPQFPDLSVVNPQAARPQMLGLHWYCGLRLDDPHFAGRREAERWQEALGRALHL